MYKNFPITFNVLLHYLMEYKRSKMNGTKYADVALKSYRVEFNTSSISYSHCRRIC